MITNMSRQEDFDPQTITEEEKDLAGQIIRLLEDPDKMAHYRQMAIKRAGDYTTESYIERICEWAGIAH